MYTKKELEEAVSKSFSLQETLRNLGRKSSGSLYRCVRNNILKYNIDISHFKTSSKLGQKASVFSFGLSNKRVGNKTLIRALIKSGREYKCELCSIKEWRSNKLTLEVHHLDSNCHNNNIENLQILCPNCHSQIEKLKNKKDIANWQDLCECGNKKTKYVDICRKCYYEKFPPEYKISWPSNEELIELYTTKPMAAIARDLKVSLTTIRKKMYSLGLKPLGKGYWQKKLQSKK